MTMSALETGGDAGRFGYHVDRQPLGDGRIKRTSPRYGIYASDGALVEGGFFTRAAAEKAAHAYRSEAAMHAATSPWM